MVAVLRRLALASIAANVTIVVTGGAVRLTDSGLGCPTWPRCTDASYTATAEMGVHGAIEFGNRLFTYVVGLVALAAFVAAWRRRPRRRSQVLLAGAVLLGIPLQGVIGGITVLTDLNPWVVGLHFLASIAMLAVAYALWRSTGDPPATASTVPPPLRPLVWLVAAASAAVLVVGTWVTGSGPHSGDHGAARNGLDPETISQVHADLVFLLLGLTVAAWFAFRATGLQAAARAALVLLAVELGQGLIGFVQYFTDLPVVLVGAHMLGACLVWLATLSVLWTLHTTPAPEIPPTPEPRGTTPAPHDELTPAPLP
ncbi:COX15/CtaA family protein [Phytohabitans sp. ZYX-F-186]|uniref:COX15/CtaA family protein n=1 Tax=Phytohabitans maris TaxID=3071409 RepID=A0ABU0ZE64_9ACTN|nr:COX15/CtaA family protein [Phytohabitans sp. ZYX-F-186]MDQ7904237.1 COX15/CtaA family protein [Phytohabitans sp. ZYX-F-186]